MSQLHAWFQASQQQNFCKTSAEREMGVQAKAWDSLAMFYEACAQIEIDELRDYQKALQVYLCSLNSMKSCQYQRCD